MALVAYHLGKAFKGMIHLIIYRNFNYFEYHCLKHFILNFEYLELRSHQIETFEHHLDLC
jgi:hypothetical protein